MKTPPILVSFAALTATLALTVLTLPPESAGATPTHLATASTSHQVVAKAVRKAAPKQVRVTAKATTSTPVASFDVSISGKVGGPARRPVAVLAKVGDGWGIIKTGYTSNHKYTLWIPTNKDPRTLRVVAAKTKTSPGGLSKTITIRPTTQPSAVMSVTGTSCRVVGDGWDVALTLTLMGGERLGLRYTLTGDSPYIGVVETLYGTRLNVDEYFNCR